MLQDPAKVAMSVMFIWFSFTVLCYRTERKWQYSWSSIIVLCYRTEPKWLFSWCSFTVLCYKTKSDWLYSWCSLTVLCNRTGLILSVHSFVHVTWMSQNDYIHDVHLQYCVTGLSPASITMFTVFMLCAVLQDRAKVIAAAAPKSQWLYSCCSFTVSQYATEPE